MAYENSTASSSADLLDKLRVFLIADGWTVNDWRDELAQYYGSLVPSVSKVLHVMKNIGESGDNQDCYFNFRSCDYIIPFQGSSSGSPVGPVPTRLQGSCKYGIAINGSTGYDNSSGGSIWDQQPGNAKDAAGNAMGACMVELGGGGGLGGGGTFTYYFFSTPSNVSVVARQEPGQWAHMSFGRMINKNPYTGGMYFSASSYGYQPSYAHYIVSDNPTSRVKFLSMYTTTTPAAAYMWLDIDGDADWRAAGRENNRDDGHAGEFAPGGSVPYLPLASGNAFAWSSFIVSRSPNQANNMAPLQPIHCFVQKASTRWVYTGLVEGIRVLNRSYFSDSESIIYGDSGGDEWVIFPNHQSNETDPWRATMNVYTPWGLAYKKVD
jgi:hypothetical protein